MSVYIDGTRPNNNNFFFLVKCFLPWETTLLISQAFSLKMYE